MLVASKYIYAYVFSTSTQYLLSGSESGAENYFTMPRLQKITRECLVGLQYVHSLGLIHCDLKPENVCAPPSLRPCLPPEVLMIVVAVISSSSRSSSSAVIGVVVTVVVGMVTVTVEPVAGVRDRSSGNGSGRDGNRNSGTGRRC